MATLPKPPKTYTQFIRRFPDLGKAWESINEAGQSGPLDERTQRLVKLAVAIGAMREGAVHSSVRKALALGITAEELDQVVALAAGALSMPATVAVWTWVEDVVAAADQAGEEKS
jgi:alkylhydroperoxidase/carboxymuconolactone decarboxylase family protein YurZ